MTEVDQLTTLHERHSELCAKAHKQGVEVPSDLTVDFDDPEVGRAVCASLENLLRERGLAEGAEVGHKEPAKPKKQKKPAASEAASQKEESNMSATKTTAKKSTAKKAAKKTAKKAKTKAAAKKTGIKRASGDGKSAKVIAMLKRASGATRAQILELTGWKAVSVQQLAESAGIKLKVDETKRPFVYRAA